MKALFAKFSLFSVIVFSLMLGGCGTMVGSGLGYKAGGPAGALVGAGLGYAYDQRFTTPYRFAQYGYGYGQQYQHQGAPIRTAPCQPFEADGLMHWAQAAGGATQHSRSASVTTNNGVTHCSSNESASSRTVPQVPR